MDGDIVVHSEPGNESTFSITLTLGRAQNTQSTKVAPALAAKGISPMLVLVAEDNKTNRFLISKYLKDLPIDVHFAHDGREAVENAKELSLDLIFMDTSMPEMDGLGATKHIRAQQQVQPRIIALTANAFANDRKACFDAGMDDFLAKPVKKADLLLKLAELSAEMAANQL